MQEPGERDFRIRDAALFGDGRDSIDDGVVCGLFVHAASEAVVLCALSISLAALRAVLREEAASQRAPRDEAHTLGDAERIHFALLLPVDEVVVILHRGEARETQAIGRV